MIIQVFPCRPLSTNTYVVACTGTRKAAVIDPAPDSTRSVVSYLNEKQLSLEKILLTHSHWDHIADVANLLACIDVPVYIHPLDKQNLETPGSDGLPTMVQVKGVAGALPLVEGDMLPIGELVFRVIHTPGHSPGGVCFYCKKEGILFSGDTLFKGSIGTLALPTADPPSMWVSLGKLGALPLETKVYPGHGVSTTIQNESWLKNAEEIFG